MEVNPVCPDCWKFAFIFTVVSNNNFAMIELIEELDHTHEKPQPDIQQCHPRPSRQSHGKGVESASNKKSKKQPQQKIPYSTPQQIYGANLINENLQVSFSDIPSHIVMAIRQRMTLSEDQVYMGVLGEDKSYIARLYADGGDEKYLKQAITDLFDSVHSHVIDGIYGDQYKVHHKVRVTKEQLRLGRDPIKFKQLKQKLQDNLSALKSEITLDVDRISVSVIDPQDFSLKSQKTKKAEQFVRNMRSLQSADRKRKQQIRTRKQSLEVRSLQEKRETEEQVKQQKHELVVKRYRQKRDSKAKEAQHIKKQEQKFRSFMEQHKNKKPLFEKYQQRYHKTVAVEETKKRIGILSQIREQRAPIDMSEIKQHQQRHKEYLEEKEEEWEAAQDMVRKERRKSKRKYFHGKFHSLIKKEEEDRQQFYSDPKVNLEELYKKRWDYAEMIRQKYMPKASPEKNKQIQQLLQKLKWSERLRANSLNRNAHDEGIRNLQKMHQLIAEMRAKGRLRIETPQLTQSTKPNYANYLEEMRKDQQYSSRYNRSRTIDYDLLVERDIGFASIQARKMEQEARQKEKYLSFSDSQDVARHMQDKKRVDDNYIDAARVKMAILSQINE